MTLPAAVPGLAPPPGGPGHNFAEITAESPKSGWYADPWNTAGWRRWDGDSWTHHSTERVGKPKLPSWISWPVVASAILSVPIIGIYLALSVRGVALGFIPVLIVGPAIWWLDRVEPEPRESVIHAVLWGAFVATLTAIIGNTTIGLLSNETVAAVVAAPFFEEIFKGLGLVYALRRKELDNVIDGVVYAAWIALGFAVVENFQYFANGDEEGYLLQVFVMRAIATPFLHPLFTFWTGFAIAKAAMHNKPLRTAWWGLVLAMLSHAIWNGLFTWVGETENVSVMALIAVFFVVLFAMVGRTVYRQRREDEHTLELFIPIAEHRYRQAPGSYANFGNWDAMLAARKQLSGSDRKRFDQRRTALARLADLHHSDTAADPIDEALALAQLRD